MRGGSLPGGKHIQGNPLDFHLRMFATALREAAYRHRAMCSKLGLLADLGLLLNRTARYRPDDKVLAFLESLLLCRL